jgi:hypothetical protein
MAKFGYSSPDNPLLIYL